MSVEEKKVGSLERSDSTNPMYMYEAGAMVHPWVALHVL